VRAAHALRLFARRAFRTVRLAISVEGYAPFAVAMDRVSDEGAAEGGDDGHDHVFPAVTTAPSDTATVVFTSGSTGAPKGVTWTHGNLQGQRAIYRDLFAFGEDAIDLVTFPVFAIPALSLGNTCVLPWMDFSRPGDVDPLRIAEAISAHAPTHSFGSPALWKRVVAYASPRAAQFPSLRLVATGGTAVAPSLLAGMQAIFPNAVVSTPYGATEALPVTYVTADVLRASEARTLEGQGTCLGTAAPSVDVRVVAFATGDDAVRASPLPAGEIGEIAVSGPIVTEAYFAREDLTAKAKFRDQGRLWHRMGDAGYLDARGLLLVLRARATPHRARRN
ncbi:peptide synthase, partial [bacterium]